MTKPYTEAHFSALIAQDRTWRLKEISDLRTAIRRSDDALRRVLLRALTAICYAHWEGYVRFSARKYLEFVAIKKYRFKELHPQFLKNSFLPRLAALSMNKTSLNQRCQLLDEVLGSTESRFARINDELINTRANLNFGVFSDICLICGLDAEVFRSKGTFVDVLLLKRRNEIAHGEETHVAFDDLDQITNVTVELIRSFGDELENNIYLRRYKAAA